jgi:carbamoyltransferase
MIVLGINAYHGDASACIFVDDKLIAAAEEERFTRIKHTAGFPIKAINFCLRYAKIDISEVDHIAINRNSKKRFFYKLIFFLCNFFKFNFIKSRLFNLKKVNSLKQEFNENFKEKINAKIHNIDHHISHIASSVYFSNFENSNFISVDGFGDFASTLIGNYDGKTIKVFDEILFPHSLGLFYTAITQYLGFLNYGDEYKVMGLASYGRPIYLEKMNNIFDTSTNKLFNLNLEYFLHHKGNVEMTWSSGKPIIGRVYSDKLINLLGTPRKSNQKIDQMHMDVAASAQKIYENFLTDIANKLYDKNPSDFLCLTGGCAMNSVANGNLYKNTNYKKIYIPSSPGDAGGSVGAASIVINKINNISKFSDNPYLGPFYNNHQVLKILEKNNIKINDITDLSNNKLEVKFFNEMEELLRITAENIYKGKIVGFYNGRMEWGPRALGNRSILADPRNKDIRSILNVKIKRREEFRPFAPSILKEKVSEWFVFDDDVPFMSKVIEIRKEKKQIIPAVTHIDGTGRLQTVTKQQNKIYYNLIKHFYNLSGVPILLNTSFNENEPMVCSPQEALDCFLRTKMDCLVLENYLITRTSS